MDSIFILMGFRRLSSDLAWIQLLQYTGGEIDPEENRDRPYDFLKPMAMRVVNIDPGYINAYHLILTTTKPCPHRPYLQKGIYADLTLIYRKQSFRALPWTYPDYQSDKMIAIMNVLRQKYLFQFRKGPFSDS